MIYNISKYGKIALMAVAVAVAATSCNKEDVQQGEQLTDMRVNLVMEDGETRASVPFPANGIYTGKYYLYEDIGHKGDYSFKEEMELNNPKLELKNLTVGAKYKLVFMAIPKGQTPDLPEMKVWDVPVSYASAWGYYLDKTQNTIPVENDIFRDILSFEASPTSAEQNAVLTRQNGAVEVRIKNIPNMKKVTLTVTSPVAMALNDGTGGQVLQPEDNKETVSVTNVITDGLDKTEMRIRVNVLPQEDITYNENTKQGGFLTIVYNDGTQKDFPLSTSRFIPVYPNQVTWLTLGTDGGDFDFGGNLGLEDEWNGGWN